MNRDRKRVVTGALLALLMAGALVSGGCRSGSADVIPQPGMLYFYAEW